MSNAGQIAAGVVGGVIGFFAGGPGGAYQGAYYGFSIGLAAGTLLFPTQLEGLEGPRLEDFERPQADPGAPIFQIFGTAPVPGFRMYLGPVVEIESTEEVGGKGPPEQEVTTFQYTQTLGLGLCEGPISGVARVWENGQLVMDARPHRVDESDEDYAARVEMTALYEETFTLHRGSETQLPDPTFELEQGMGNVPGFRGLAYMVYPDRELLQSQGLRHPVFKIEVVGRGELTLTSRPYALEVFDGMDVAGVAIEGVWSPSVVEFVSVSGEALDGTLDVPLVGYDNWPPEEMLVSGEALDGTLVSAIAMYDNWPPEEMSVSGEALDGTLDVQLVQYDDWPPEEMSVSGEALDGTLV